METYQSPTRIKYIRPRIFVRSFSGILIRVVNSNYTDLFLVVPDLPQTSLRIILQPAGRLWTKNNMCAHFNVHSNVYEDVSDVGALSVLSLGLFIFPLFHLSLRLVLLDRDTWVSLQIFPVFVDTTGHCWTYSRPVAGCDKHQFGARSFWWATAPLCVINHSDSSGHRGSPCTL